MDRDPPADRSTDAGSGAGGGRSGRESRRGTRTARSGRTAASAAGRVGRTRARQGPRRDPQRVVRRRPPLRAAAGPAAAAARARRAAQATGGALGLSTARRAAVLAVVVCALALTVAVPLRNYVTQRHEIAAVAAQQDRLAAEVAALSAQRDALRDPAHVEALARERLGYARPGETPYRVELPGDAAAAAARPDPAATLAPAESDLPWYARVARSTLGTAP